MAAAGFTPISLYYSTTATAVPSSGSLVAGELALNTTDEKLYFKNAAGTVKLLASNASASGTTGTSILYGNGTGGFSNVTIGTGVTFAGGTLSATGTGGTVTSVAVSGGTTGLTTSGGPITTSGTITLAGTLAVANGGTGQISYTDGQLLIGNSTGNTLTKATLTAGTGITITNGSGAITIAAAASGVTAIELFYYANANA
jgi:hypothetical protein